MMVTFVSQCEKKALSRTRRVLDSFANRIGDNTWQTVITAEGLQAVKKLLRKTASKSTAVSCFWIRSRSRSELVWIVGKRDKFNSEGIVPVNTTGIDHLKSHQENSWHNADVIALLAGIAGLFHDFGKANILFQNKLDPKHKGKNWEPYRHEWVSLRFFQAFVGQQTDMEWLQSLEYVKEDDERTVLKRLIKEPKETINNPLSKLPFTAKLVAWLIVSHHKLPTYPNDKASNAPSFKYINQWLDEAFDSLWNSANSLDDWDEQVRIDNWVFPNGTPLLSVTWRDNAKSLATRALRCNQLTQQNWFDNRFTAHLSRLVLMLADHYYSASGKTVQWQDQRYKSYANTEGGELKQKLDEHNIGVASNAYLLARKLPNLKADLPTLGYDRKFIQHTKIKKFLWQNKAYNLAKSLSDQSENYGFFGINMASTGLGKTLSNARIMYALSGDKKGCRFNVALGLRTLTLQTGDALAERLKLDETELAVLIGSQAVKRLHENNKQNNNAKAKENELKGSESLETLFSKEIHVEYKGALNDGVLSKWLGQNAKLEKLLNAPVLISTIDYLIPATEGTRGGKQIAPMLRLLTSDLVLDEPDDFGLEDLPALCRLVNWAGVLGSRVLLSTATMPPALAYALFEAYQAGRRDFTAVNGDLGKTDTVCCAWFDESGCTHTSINDKDKFRESHSEFVEKRISKLSKNKQILRKARLLPVICAKPEEALEAISTTIHDAIHQLHKEHHQKHSIGKKVSIGLVRMANINPLVAVAKELFFRSPDDDFQIHYCVYHSQFPLAVRSHIEQKLDAALTRHNEDDLWLQEEIKQAIETEPEKHHVFVVLATSVAEVGRDHDYDWAIAEPSSMRSLIQLAGRIQRHRKQEPETENLLILSQNFKALKGVSPAYCRPGFETKNRKFANHDLVDLLKQENYQHINATPRIQMPQGKLKLENGEYLDFVQLEQWALFQRLLGAGKEENNARLWWGNQPTWNGELQRTQPFRRSSPDAPYCLYSEEENEDLYWTRKDETSKPVTYPETDVIETKEINIADRNKSWISLETGGIYSDLAGRLGANRKYVSKVFGEIRLREDKEKVISWCYHPVLGVYSEL
jgi:CRISPR-associated endonuclease/helicase Cas3